MIGRICKGLLVAVLGVILAFIFSRRLGPE